MTDQTKRQKAAKHHYLPQFYLKGFTNENGEFMIYMVKEGVFKKEGKYFSPASHFFLPDDNTVIIEGVKDNFLEENYSRMESMVARVFEKIKAVDSNFGLADIDIPLLQYFVAELFWRLPSQREVIEGIANTRSLKQLGVAVLDKTTLKEVNDDEFQLKTKNNPIYKTFLRTILPVTTYLNLFECTSPVTIFTFPKGLPAICSDNPLILRNPEKLDPYTDDFILPLTENKVMIRIKRLKPKFWSTVKVDIDMLLLVQAKEYVCCVDEEYLKLLKASFSKNYGSIDLLRKKVFESIDEGYPLEAHGYI